MVHLSRISEEPSSCGLAESSDWIFVLVRHAIHRLLHHAAEAKPGRARNLVRGKSGRVVGALNALITMTKGLPMAYNRDLQEDCPPFFDAMHTTIARVRVTAGCFESMTVKGGSDLTGDFALTTGASQTSCCSRCAIPRGTPRRRRTREALRRQRPDPR